VAEAGSCSLPLARQYLGMQILLTSGFSKVDRDFETPKTRDLA